MRTILHLSDLHFGRINRPLLKPLLEKVAEIKPDLVAISGDLTQRARSHEFQEARAFLDALPKPQIIVPGNHDVPLHNVLTRFFQPLDKYRRYITEDLLPFYVDDEIAVIGTNTARSLTIKGGRINEGQVNQIKEIFCRYTEKVIKIVVTHHPFDLPEGYDDRDLVGRARMAVTSLADCGADVFLAGHLHIAHTRHTAIRYPIKGYAALIIQAGTAISTRERGEPNSFNVVRIRQPLIDVEKYQWGENASFTLAMTEHFRHTSEGWVQV